MSGYSAEELAAGWEFKIIRSSTGSFRRPDFLARILEEERRHGWTLVEKFDNSRVRLKRPASSRAGDAASDAGAYRSYVGMSEPALAMTIVASILAVFGVVLGIVAIAR